MAGTYVTVKTVWDAPAILQAPLRGVFRLAAAACFKAMDEASPEHDLAGVRVVSMTETTATASGTGLASMFEHGRTGGYPINPKASAGFRNTFSKKFGMSFTKFRQPSASQAGGSGVGVLKFTRGDGGFAANALGGSEAPRPFMMPVAATFRPVFYEPLARAAISGRTSSLVSGLLH